jgi:hypothetical protein
LASKDDYHGIIIDLSQKNTSVLKSLEIIGCKKAFFNLASLCKVRVPSESIESTITRLQSNMREGLWPLVHGFYFHFYNNDELIVVFKNKIFRGKPEPGSFGEMIDYGKSLGIPEKQLDFFPYRFDDESY